MIGTTLAHYRITGKLGAGGMGEVWRAEDTKLGRDVALKVLPAEFAEDEQRLERFQREAKVLASLNHSNIAHLYGLESIASETETETETEKGTGTDAGPQDPKTSGPQDPTTPEPQPPNPSTPVTFLVMELVEGEDLSERIAHGAIPIDEAIPIALQIAEALEAAHEAGIVHRDLKPANIKLKADGTVKVLDFGLAKTWESDTGNSSLSLSPTLTQHATAAGVILGTAAYMSPEQARGKPVDRRADIWAYGVVLWETLTGRKLFEGETVTDVLASVLKEPPDLEALPAETPPSLRRLVTRSLDRDPRDRLQWIGDARLDLTEAQTFDGTDHTDFEVTDGSRNRSREWFAWSIAVVSLLVAAALWLRPTVVPETPLTRFTLGLGSERTLSFIDQPILAFSPDGRTLAMTATDADSTRDAIVLRRLDEGDAVHLEDTAGAGEMFFSPDGLSVAFFADAKLKRVSVAGGSAVTIADAPNPRGGVWLPDGTILYSPLYASGLWKIAVSGGVAEEVVKVGEAAGERTLRFPHATPDGEIVLFTVGFANSPNNYEDASIDVYSFETGVRRRVIERATMARFVSRERIIFTRMGDLFAIDFDPGRLEVVGEPMPVIEDVGGDPSSGAGYFSISSNGDIAWLAGAVTAADTLLTIIDEDGVTERVPLDPRGFFQPRFSPDGNKLAFTVGEGYSGVAGDVWVYSSASEGLSRLTFGGNELYPLWAPDGDRIAYLNYENDASILAKAADGSSAGEILMEGELNAIFPESFSPDGRTLAYTRIGPTADIFLVTEGEEPRLFEEQASCPAISPDGRWIAYSSPGSGTSSIYVRPLEGDGKWQVSPDLGGYPRWSGDGRRLFYIDIGSTKRPLMRVDVVPGDTFSAGPPEIVIENLGAAFVTATAPAMNWDVAPAGDRFVFVEFERRAQAAAQIEVALNWAQHLELENK